MRSCEPLLNWTKTGTNGALNILNALFRPDAVVTPLCCFPCGYSRGRLLDRLHRFKAYIHFSCFCWAGTHQIFIWQNPNLLCRSLWSVPCLAPHGNRVQGLPRLWSCGSWCLASMPTLDCGRVYAGFPAPDQTIGRNK